MSTDLSPRALSLAVIIKQQREAAGMSARALSLQAGLSESYVGKVESSEMMPSLVAFARIVVTLGLNPREIAQLVMQEAGQ